MDHRIITAFAALVLAGNCHLAYAQGFLGGQNGLDPKFCETAAVRQTVVYVDDMFMQDDQKEWAAKLYGKLKGTLVPGERVTVVELSPSDGQSREAWTGCWPDYAPDERVKLGNSYSFFQKNPLKALEDQQGFFASGFGGAVSEIYDKHHHPLISIDPASPPAKAIINALASDEARYSHTRVTVRAIIYSDLAENSELGSIYKTQSVPFSNIGKKLGTYLRSSVFYAFGMDGDVNGGQEIRDNTRKLWTHVLETTSATIGGMGSDLNVSNALPVASHEYVIDLKEGETPLSGRLSLLVDADGGLVDSWIGIERLSTASLSGTARCDVGGESTCMINATTSHGILSDSPSEALTLRGSASKPLTGVIGVKGSNVMFDLTATSSIGR